jgi:hypothetical protein
MKEERERMEVLNWIPKNRNQDETQEESPQDQGKQQHVIN